MVTFGTVLFLVRLLIEQLILLQKNTFIFQIKVLLIIILIKKYESFIRKLLLILKFNSPQN